ncbi:MAG: HipA domain-containing protein [Opitutales bacterium]|nr:HipA domain-containing protein [Opitutales bacterium]
MRGLAGIPAVKPERCVVENVTITGEAPKDFLRIYLHGEGGRNNSRAWPRFIAKVGHKWYPTESITEHLLTRLGQALGFELADSQLFWVRGQLRFCSRYFLEPGESLVHGAEIFWGYLDDRAFVERIEAEKQARNFFTFGFVQDALLEMFPDEAHEILEAFVKMLIFDALVGNNDRHFYNWGVVLHPEGKFAPRFSPIYDTARALFWNFAEDRLAAIRRDNGKYLQWLRKYCTGSKPKIGWDGQEDLNHFDLLRHIFRPKNGWRPLADHFQRDQVMPRVENVLDHPEFEQLLSPMRREIILDCLSERLNLFESCVI